MRKQSYNNHIRFYYPHHFIFYPAVIILFIISIKNYFNTEQLEFALLTTAFFILGWVSFMMRQHYALNNQNRIIRLEMRVRYFQLTAKRLDIIENKLSFGQIAALRFASDEELPLLVERVLEKGLSPSDIKKSIKNWQPDYMRV